MKQNNNNNNIETKVTRGKDRNVIIQVANNDFEETGNESFSWLLVARRLLKASEALKEAVGDDVDYLSVILMLRGMAIENLIKGTYLKNKKIVNDGKLTFPEKFKKHNLVFMASSIKLDLNSDLIEALNMLSSAINFYGRYPIPNSIERWGIKTVSCEGGQTSFLWSDGYNNVTGRLIKTLQKGIENNAKNN